MDKFIKRLQTRANRKGITVSKSQVREVYQSVVATPESPSEEEMSAVIQRLEVQYQAPSHETHEATDLVVSEPSSQVQEIRTEQPTPVPQQEPQQMPPAQAPAQPSNSTLATSNHSALSKPTESNLAITQQQIQEAIEERFGKENLETKTAILNHVAQDTFATAQELQIALSKLRQMRLDVLMKLISDHNQASSSDEDLLKKALQSATASRHQETEDFFGNFENQLQQMRAAFGI